MGQTDRRTDGHTLHYTPTADLTRLTRLHWTANQPVGTWDRQTDGQTDGHTLHYTPAADLTRLTRLHWTANQPVGTRDRQTDGHTLHYTHQQRISPDSHGFTEQQTSQSAHWTDRQTDRRTHVALHTNSGSHPTHTAILYAAYTSRKQQTDR